MPTVVDISALVLIIFVEYINYLALHHLDRQLEYPLRSCDGRGQIASIKIFYDPLNTISNQGVP